MHPNVISLYHATKGSQEISELDFEDQIETHTSYPTTSQTGSLALDRRLRRKSGPVLAQRLDGSYTS